MRRIDCVLVLACLLGAAAAAVGEEAGAPSASRRVEPFAQLFNQHCGLCHGENLLGAAQGTPLVGSDLAHGDSIDSIVQSIRAGFADAGMPAWSATLSAGQIQSLAIYVAEERAGTTFVDFKVNAPLRVPDTVLASELHDFRLETVIDGLDPLPYSIAPLPDGRLLLTEKMRGLSVVSADGEQSGLIAGAP